MLKKRRIVFGLLMSTIALTACSLAPTYQRPSMPIPAYYKEITHAKESTQHWVSANSNNIDIISRDKAWWHMFHDQILNELEEKLINANQDLKIALAHYQEACAAVQVARSLYYPLARSIAYASRQQTSKHIANPNTYPLYNDFLIGADLNYELDVWGRIRNTVAASQNNAKASANDLAAVKLSLQTQLAINYINLRANEVKEKILNATVSAYQKALYLTKKRHDGGVAPISDVDYAEAQLETAKVTAENNRLQQAQLEHAIAVLVGEIPANFKLDTNSNNITVLSKSASLLESIPSTLLQRRPDIHAAEERVKAANAEIGVAYAAFYPSFNLVSALGFQSDMLSNLISKPSLFWSLGPTNLLSLSQPMVGFILFDGGKRRGLLHAAKANYFETVALYRQTVLTAFQEVEDNLAAIHRLDEEKRFQARATIAAISALQQEKNRYFGGVATYLDVVISENAALQAKLALIDIRLQRQIASIQLIKALGGGWTSPPNFDKQGYLPKLVQREYS